jgi:hypothetical protein
MRQGDSLRSPSRHRASRDFSPSVSIRMRRSRFTTPPDEQTVHLLELARSTLMGSQLNRSLCCRARSGNWARLGYALSQRTRSRNPRDGVMLPPALKIIWLTNRVSLAQQGSSFQSWFREMWRFSWRHIDTLSNSLDC